jgi:hypothetical protein
MNDNAKHWIDALSIGTVIGALVAWLPPMAALASLIWSAIRIWETRTVQSLVARVRGVPTQQEIDRQYPDGD